MPRLLSYSAALAAAVILSATGTAQPPEPTQLARGLREAGLPDLALEYLDEIRNTKLSPATLAVLPLERARAKLAMANDEPDDSRRVLLISEAREGFEQFLKNSPNHPRRPEAAISLAQVISVEAKGMVSAANKLDGEARKAALARARPIFDEASKRFGQAADEYAKQLNDPSLSPSQKRELTRDVYQAKLDRAINYFRLATSYDPPEGIKEIQVRGQALDKARDLFIALGKEDPNHPLSWVAVAWSGECEREKTNPREAELLFNRVYEAARTKPSIAGLGERTARFFDLKAKYLDSVSANDQNGLRRVMAGFESWLREPQARIARPAPEVYQARYYLGFTKQRLAELSIKKDAKSGTLNIPNSAKELLAAAEREYKRVLETENDYTNRAAERRTTVIRLLLGNAEINPATLDDLERVLMAAQVQLYKAFKESKGEEEKKANLKKVIALYERARELPVPKELTRDVLDAQLNLAFAYISSDMPYQAAILGEHLARSVRQAAMAAKAGVYAMQAYSLSAAKLDPTDLGGRRADLQRIADLGLFLDKRFPLDTNTDNARMIVSQQWLREGKYQQAFELIARINNSSPRLATARLMEGVAAYELLRPPPAGADVVGTTTAKLTPEEKGVIFQRVLSDLTTIPAAPVGTPAADAKVYGLISLQIAELHMLDRPRGYTAAEQAAKQGQARVAAFTELPDEDKQELQFKLENARLRAIYGQVFPLFQDKKYAELMTQLGPVLAEMKQGGPAEKPGLSDATAAAARRLDEFRRNEIIVLALRARIQEGAIDQATELFDLLKKYGGSLQASLQAIANLVAVVKPQVEDLRRENKGMEADQLVAVVSQMLDKVAAEVLSDPTKYSGELVVLGRSIRELGNYEKAIELLKQVPAPPNEADLRKRITELDETTRPPVTRYKVGLLELIRAYREAGKYNEADELLVGSVGIRDFRDKSKDKPGWAANSLEYRKEVIYLLEARATAAPDNKKAIEFWGQANQQWGLVGREYLNIVSTGGGKGPPKDEREKQDRERVKAQFKPIYHDLVFEQLRCVTKANQHVLKNSPDKLGPKLQGVAGQMVALETANADLAYDVKMRFANLMEEVPALKAEYEKMPDSPKGMLKSALNESTGLN